MPAVPDVLELFNTVLVAKTKGEPSFLRILRVVCVWNYSSFQFERILHLPKYAYLVFVHCLIFMYSLDYQYNLGGNGDSVSVYVM